MAELLYMWPFSVHCTHRVARWSRARSEGGVPLFPKHRRLAFNKKGEREGILQGLGRGDWLGVSAGSLGTGYSVGALDCYFVEKNEQGQPR